MAESQFKQIERTEIVRTLLQRLTNAETHIKTFNQQVADAATEWAKYLATNPDTETRNATGLDFAAKSRELVDARKAALAASLDILAASMIDGEGNPLTRQNLLDEIAAV